MALPSIKEISEKAQNTFKKFPITLVWAIVGSFYFIVLLGQSEKKFEEHLPLLLTFILGISWLIAARFFIERFAQPKKWIWVKGVVLALLVIYYWQLPKSEQLDGDIVQLTRFFLYFIAGHLFVLFAPFIGKWDNAAYWNYLKSVGFAILRSGIFSGVLYIGLVLALAAINALFDANVPGERYGQLFIFCLGIANTWIYLSDFPKNVLETNSVEFNKALEVFVKYILIPLVLLYIVILYAYGFKIVFEWQLPQGWVSYLVTALAILGFVVQVIINPVQKTLKSWSINLFYPCFYYLLLPLVLLLFIAIFRRIADYGITENRYFVVSIAFWILGMTLYLLFSKNKRLKVLPISLFLLALMTSFGFWGTFQVSINSQTNQFAKVFQNVRANNNMATADEYQRLQSVLDYLNKRESLTRLNNITDIDMHAAFEDSLNDKFGSYRWLDTSKVMDSLGIKMSPEELAKTKYGNNYYYYYSSQNKTSTYTLEDFDQFSVYNLYPYNDENDDKIGDFLLNYDTKNVEFTLSQINRGDEGLHIPLRTKLETLSQYGNELSNLREEQLTMNVENDSIKLRLIFKDLGFYIEKDSVSVNNAQLYLFLKQK
ncbi:MAG: DUF4153 domain-containing protein [Flavobacteriaceae bacterium]